MAGVWTAEVGPLVARARAEGLARDPRWRALLHIAPSWRGERSVVDDARFFLAAQGATDPEAELEADLRALLASPPQEGQPFIERFPARARFLCEALGIPRSALPVPRAAACEDALASFGARSGTLVFASGYLGAPASMFGHTLLVIRGRYDSLALAQAINYAAETTTSSGIEFAVRGIFGGYQGTFSLLPYHRKIGEYADLDQRDLWEYDLTFTPEELCWLLMHVWELRGIGSDYWFFDENCSWRLLFLLDVARPSLGLRRHWSAWCIPLDTVKRLVEAGLVTAPRHRPSRRTRVLALLTALDGPGRSRVEALVAGDGDPATSSARELEAAAELLQARLAKGGLDLPAYQRRLVAITGARSHLPTDQPLPIPVPTAPHLGHPSARGQVAAGQDHGRPFGSLRLRPAYHDLTDPQEGFDPGTRIDFAHVELRWYRSHAIELHRVEAVAISSYPPLDHLGLRPSYRIGAGLVAEPQRDDPGWRRRAWLDGGTGIAVGSPACLGVLLVGAATRLGTEAPRAVLGLGPSLVLVAQPMDQLRLVAEADLQPGLLGERVGNGQVGVTASWFLGHAVALIAEAHRARTWGVDGGQWMGGVRWYW